ncbi:MAG: protein-glutamate O-methyltransferase CheR [Mariprofundaceae bacterium]
MEVREFDYVRGFLLRKSGLVVNQDKMYLIQSRLQPLLRKHDGLETLEDLSRSIKRNESSELAREVIDAMTTNETLFFRDQYPFEALKTLVFPELTHSKGLNGKINIWSAAASRGQEAFSIAITASEAIPQADKRVQILGTDISNGALNYGKEAVYSQMEVQRGMPVKQLIRFFDQDGVRWKVRPELKGMVTFKPANLIDDMLSSVVRLHGPFDIVFLRNVLIYFAPEERPKVIDRIARNMTKGGYLITGATETPAGVTSKWEMVMFKGKRIWKMA